MASDLRRRSQGTRDHHALRGDSGGAGGGVGPDQSRRPVGGARCRGRRVRREARGEASADHALCEAAAQLLARPLLARDGQPCPGLARALHAGRRGPGGGEGISETLVLVDRADPVAIVLLNRPQQLNALSGALMEELVAALQELDEQESVRCIVLGGNERAFAAGADVAELAAGTPVSLYQDRRLEHWDAIRAVRTPLVAAVSGFCLGGGCELAMACDVIVASETAKFGQPEINLGVMPGAGGTQRLTRAVGKAVAMDMILSGRMLGADEARDLGLVARVVAREAWLDEAKRAAAEIASKGPIAVRLAKEAVDQAFEVPLSAGVEFERRAFYLARASEDATEGLTAFVQKRTPD